MEAYKVDSGDPSTFILGFKDPNTSVITPLIDFLEKNEDVEYVRYIEKHPELEDIQLLLKVKEGKDPKSIIISALSEMEPYFNNTNYTECSESFYFDNGSNKKKLYADGDPGNQKSSANKDSGKKKLYADGN